jgi:hypothetical protein
MTLCGLVDGYPEGGGDRFQVAGQHVVTNQTTVSHLGLTQPLIH